MRFKDKEAWDKTVAANDDFYGMGAIRYAERWANLMETEVASGKAVAEVAKRTSHEADTEGITGFMYGCAVGILAFSWEHGEELRRWHNLDAQIHTEGMDANADGGVLNPAVICLS